MKTYIWAIDAGHEWLAVRKSELEELGIADQISAYSYQKGSTAYLEGDCDAARFLDAYRAKHGVEAKTKEGKRWIVNHAVHLHSTHEACIRTLCQARS